MLSFWMIGWKCETKKKKETMDEFDLEAFLNLPYKHVKFIL